jgi:hypothetical protein
MIDDFKFFQENHIYKYNGEMAREAILCFCEYVASNRANCEVTTQIARYRIGTLSFNAGQLFGGMVYVFPIEDSSMKITFHINKGEITPYITAHEIDYA